MLVHSDPLFTIYFGDKRSQFDVEHASQLRMSCMLDINPFKKVTQLLGLTNLIFLRQTHGTDGFFVTSSVQAQKCFSFTKEGDFLVSNLSHIGLAIATADCIPIVLLDKTKHVVALIHAGWRGSIGEIVIKAFETMKKQFHVAVENVSIFFGPSAKGCCYTVGEDVINEIERYPFYQKVIYKTQNNIYVDLPLFNCLLFEEYGAKKEAFYLMYNVCTICDASFCSYRRNPLSTLRQMTVVALK